MKITKEDIAAIRKLAPPVKSHQKCTYLVNFKKESDNKIKCGIKTFTGKKVKFTKLYGPEESRNMARIEALKEIKDASGAYDEVTVMFESASFIKSINSKFEKNEDRAMFTLEEIEKIQDVIRAFRNKGVKVKFIRKF